MPTRTCVQCGHPLAENAKFCGQCGLIVQGHTAGATAKRTLLAVPPPTTPAPPPAIDVPIAKRTIVGLPTVTPEASRAAPIAPGPVTARAPGPPPKRTMLGVAMPGIAPLRAGEKDNAGAPTDTVAAGEVPDVPRVQPEPPHGYGGTVQMPAFFVPPPAPFPEPPVPSRPRVARRRGAPLAVAALVAGGVALGGGAAIALLWRGAPPIAAQPRIAADGHDVLHLTCDPSSCKDGTMVSLRGATAAFASGETDLTLGQPLQVGDNTLLLSIDRPGMGRDETVKLVVPVAYRVRADVSTMGDPHPCVTIRVEAPPESEVHVDDKPVLLDAKGTGTYTVDESSATDGPADESRVIAVELPYVVATKGRGPETGTVSARIAVAPLRVDAPGTRATVSEDQVLIAGRAAKGSTVTIQGTPASVNPDGTFEATVDATAPGEHVIEVRAGVGALASRTVHVTINRVASLADAARAFERAGPIGYDAAMRDITLAKTGESIVVEGEIVEVRASRHQTVLLIDDRRGCTKGPCLTRVIIGRDLTLARGETLRAYGQVARAFRTPGAQTVPEVEAEFVLKGRR
jgi:glucodextranase-like protein/zinc ribbon protein